MSNYASSLKTYLDGGVTQAHLADQIGKTQVTVGRYAKGERFPDATTARAIEGATMGAVSFTAWRAEFERKYGLTPERTA